MKNYRAKPAFCDNRELWRSCRNAFQSFSFCLWYNREKIMQQIVFLMAMINGAGQWKCCQCNLQWVIKPFFNASIVQLAWFPNLLFWFLVPQKQAQSTLLVRKKEIRSCSQQHRTILQTLQRASHLAHGFLSAHYPNTALRKGVTPAVLCSFTQCIPFFFVSLCPSKSEIGKQCICANRWKFPLLCLNS